MNEPKTIESKQRHKRKRMSSRRQMLKSKPGRQYPAVHFAPNKWKTL